MCLEAGCGCRKMADFIQHFAHSITHPVAVGDVMGLVAVVMCAVALFVCFVFQCVRLCVYAQQHCRDHTISLSSQDGVVSPELTATIDTANATTTPPNDRCIAMTKLNEVAIFLDDASPIDIGGGGAAGGDGADSENYSDDFESDGRLSPSPSPIPRPVNVDRLRHGAACANMLLARINESPTRHLVDTLSHSHYIFHDVKVPLIAEHGGGYVAVDQQSRVAHNIYITARLDLDTWIPWEKLDPGTWRVILRQQEATLRMVSGKLVRGYVTILPLRDPTHALRVKFTLSDRVVDAQGVEVRYVLLSADNANAALFV